MEMKQRILGQSGITVSEIGLGCMSMNFDFNYIVNGAKSVMSSSHTVLDQLGRAY